jgi:hypothetical protein
LVIQVTPPHHKPDSRGPNYQEMWGVSSTNDETPVTSPPHSDQEADSVSNDG